MKSVLVMVLLIVGRHCFKYRNSIPIDWRTRIELNNAFYSSDDDDIEFMPSLGNGYLSNDDGVKSDTIYVSGIFNNETTSPSHRARIPTQFGISIQDTTSLGSLLDIERGIYYRRGRLDTSNNNSASTYELRWYAHRSLKSLYVIELDFDLGDEDLVSAAILIPKVANSIDILFKPISTAFDNEMKLSCGTTSIPETKDGVTPTVCMAVSNLPTQITIKRGEVTSFTYITAIRTSLDSDFDLVAVNALRDYRSGMDIASNNQLQKAHVDAWSKLWGSGIEVSGRDDVARAINASLFAILSSVREDWPYGLAPGGLTNAYNGHSFWDTETWMYPSMLYLHPKIANSLLQYRFNLMDGARKKAISYNPPFSGTMFPWESAFSGVETCPTTAATGLREIHISGDISLAVWQEWLMHSNVTWLKSVGFPLLCGIADFWMSKITFDELDGHYHIDDVIPPDEYVDHVNDSVYTNYVASIALQYAAQAAATLNLTDSDSSFASYQIAANKMLILYDLEKGIHLEYEGYPGDIVKQADVVLLKYPLGYNMSDEDHLSDLNYYAPRTDPHGPAMTWSMFSIGYLDLSEFELAAKYFNDSFTDNIKMPFQVWTETPNGGATNFITGAGGFLQTVLSGYPGIRITTTESASSQGSLLLSPRCIPGTNYMKVRKFTYSSDEFDLEYWCDISSGSSNPTAVLLTMYPTSNSLSAISREYVIRNLVSSETKVISWKSSNIKLQVKVDRGCPVRLKLDRIDE